MDDIFKRLKFAFAILLTPAASEESKPWTRILTRLGCAVTLFLWVVVGRPIRGLGQEDVSNSNETLTLDQAIALALRANHLVKNAELEVGKAGDGLAVARTYRLPSMNFYALAAQQLVKRDVDI